MDLIYTDTNKNDIGVLMEYELDLAFGSDENNFECTVNRGSNQIESGCYLYIDETEYGGIVDGVKTDTASNDIVLSGRTWHGILNSKVLQPDSGQDYLILSGEANSILESLITRLDIGTLFSASSSDSGITISNYKMDRYISAYDGIKKMLSKVGGKLCMAYSDGNVMLSAMPVVDYTDCVDSDLIEFQAKKTINKINHLICLGSGELSERMVVHLYADGNGNISRTQTFTGVNEYAGVYDYGNAESEADLIDNGTDRFRELLNQDELNVDFDETYESYDIGDIVGATDHKSGISISVDITKKIVSIRNGKITVTYDNQNANTSATVSGGALTAVVYA